MDGHQHLHAHPAVLPIVLECALKYDAGGIRIPRDPIWANIRADLTRPISKLIVALGHSYLGYSCKRLKKIYMAHCDLSIGSLMSGRMNDDYVMKMLSMVHAKSIEVFFHPSDSPQFDPNGPNPGDLAALLSPNLMNFIATHDYVLTNYAGLKEASSERR